MVEPSSFCLECGEEFSHDRFHRICPHCGSYETTLLTGRELEIASIEVDIPDE
jgi:hydrogenase nickel incorporation protein HypA/HybF